VMTMLSEILRWIGDETLLQELVRGLPTIGLLGIIVVCILLLSKGADWMIDGVVHRRAGQVCPESSSGQPLFRSAPPRRRQWSR